MTLWFRSAVVWDILEISIPVTVFCDSCATLNEWHFWTEVLHRKLLNYFEQKSLELFWLCIQIWGCFQSGVIKSRHPFVLNLPWCEQGQDFVVVLLALCIRDNDCKMRFLALGCISLRRKPSRLYFFLPSFLSDICFFCCNSNSRCCFCACTGSETDLLACWISWTGLHRWEEK